MSVRIAVRATYPDDDCIALGAKLFCKIDRRESNRKGVILDEQGAVRWRFDVRKNVTQRSWWNPFYKKEFVVTDVRSGEEVVLRRASFFPSRFLIIQARAIIGSVCRASILRNKYTINVHGGQSWVFRMPLFSVHFFGGTKESTEFWVVIGPSKMEWNVLIKPGIADQPLVAALSLIHHMAWNYGGL